MLKKIKMAKIIHDSRKTYINTNGFFWSFIYPKNIFLTKAKHNSKICVV